MIIVLNGTAASGKGTLARKLAAHLGLTHYDFGLIYRAIAVTAARADWHAAAAAIRSGRLKVISSQILDRDVDITGQLTSEEAGLLAARLATERPVELADAAKSFVQDESFVADGRTVSQIFPQADWHFEVVADLETARERRRAQSGNPLVFDQRWMLDRHRLSVAPRAIPIHTAGMTVDESFGEMLSHLDQGQQLKPS